MASAAAAAVLSAVYLLPTWYSRRCTSEEERRGPMPGDGVVSEPRNGYTLAINIRASPSAVWPWLVQMGQGRAGFYTHEWVENLLGARIHNADRIIPAFQHLSVGDRVRLTPDPYLGLPGQFMTVVELRRPHAPLIFSAASRSQLGRQRLSPAPVRGHWMDRRPN